MYKVSIVTPTLNSGRTLPHYLAGIEAQIYPRDQLEIVVADGGSTDDTRNSLENFGIRTGITVTVLDNPLITGEAGKAVAVRHAQGDLIVLLDSDNVMPAPDWLMRMTAPMEDPEVFGAEPLEFTWRRSDGFVTRYCALIGMNDPLCHFLGNYDRLDRISMRWTGLPVSGHFMRGGETSAAGPVGDLRGSAPFDWIRVDLSADALPTIGANGTVLRRQTLLDNLKGEYLFDIDLIHGIVAHTPRPFAKVNTGIVHLFGRNLNDFHRKQRRRIRDFLHFRREQERSYAWKERSGKGVGLFILCSLTVVPLLWQAIKGFVRQPDPVWLLHPVFCWITLWAYGWGTIAGCLFKSTIDRKGWSQ